MPKFIVLSGLPGSGKSTLSKKLSAHLKAVYIRIDSIERAIKDTQYNDNNDLKDEGYLAAFAVARDNLINGLNVIADSVNSIKLTHDGYNAVAIETGADLINIEIECSDKDEHRNRVETRKSDIKNHIYPDWKTTINREYEAPDHPYIKIDTAGKTIEESFKDLLEAMQK